MPSEFVKGLFIIYESGLKSSWTGGSARCYAEGGGYCYSKS
jgi:hypothetical protein